MTQPYPVVGQLVRCVDGNDVLVKGGFYTIGEVLPPVFLCMRHGMCRHPGVRVKESVGNPPLEGSGWCASRFVPLEPLSEEDKRAAILLCEREWGTKIPIRGILIYGSEGR